jgi:hypothetical protein
MNMQLANVLSDVSGVTGQAIIKAIYLVIPTPHWPKQKPQGQLL